jgi:hypothetical protein
VNRPDARHHAIVYTTPNPPSALPGEHIKRESIKIYPGGTETLHLASRINFSKIYTVKHNLKVKNIGVVPNVYMNWVELYVDESTGSRS